MRMKKLFFRFIPAMVAVAVLACAFAVPVSAASSSWYSFNTTMLNLVGSNTAALFYNGDWYDEVDPYEWYGSAGVSYHLYGDCPVGAWTLRIPVSNINISLEAGEIFRFTALYEGVVWWEIGSDPTVRLAFVEQTVENGTTYNHVLTSYSFKPVYKESMDKYVHQFTYEWQVTADCNLNEMYIFVDVTNRELTGVGTGGRIRTYLKNIEIGYGNQDAATAPKYVTPDDGDLGNLEITEKELSDNTADGQEKVDEIMSATSLADTLLSYTAGLMFTSRVMLSAITRIPFLNALIWVAMSLGFVASLLGFAGAIISASERRASREARVKKGGGK